jgi:hypothetical protein
VVLGARFVLGLKPPFRKWILLPILVLPNTCFLKADMRWANGAKQGQWVHAEALRKAIPEGSLCVAGNDVSQRIHLYALRRKGWTFMDDSLPEEWLKKIYPSRSGLPHKHQHWGGRKPSHSPIFRPNGL